jgi:hypothetical protein
MQDNYSENEFDQSFINDSWSKLSDKLDNEMPVIVPRSRKLAYLLGATQIISLAVIAFLLYQSQQKVPFSTLTKTQTVTKEIRVDKPNDNVTIPTTITEYVQGPVQYIYVNNSEPQTSMPTRNNGSIQNNSLSSLDKLETFQLRHNYVFSKHSLHSHPKLRLELNRDQFNVDPENQISDDGGRFKNFFRNDVDFRVGVLASVSSDMDFTGYGFVASFQVAISDKFGIGTGLGFNHLSREFHFVPMLPKSRSSYDIVMRNVDLENKTTYYKSIHDLKQIFIPISLNYNLSEKISVGTGIKFRYTFNSEVDNTLKSELSQTLSSIEDPETLFFNDTNFGLSLGVNYSVSERVTLQLDSEMGINSLINENQFKSSPQSRYDLRLINFTTNYSF